MRGDFTVEIRLVLDDASDHEWPPREPRDLDGGGRPLVGVDASEEQQVAARGGVQRERICVDAVVDGRGVAERGMAVGVADGDIRAVLVVPLVDRDDLRRREPVDCGHHRRLDQPAVGQREEVEAVVDDIELAGAFESSGDVRALGDFGVES